MTSLCEQHITLRLLSPEGVHLIQNERSGEDPGGGTVKIII